MQCWKCGKEMFTSVTGGDGVCWECKNASIPNNCDIPAPPNFGKLEGWICPVCGRGVAPGVSFCPCKAGNDSTITWVSPTITVSTANPNSNANSNVTSINSGWGYVTYTDGKSE
jgi:hypothetical protein